MKSALAWLLLRRPFTAAHLVDLPEVSAMGLPGTPSKASLFPVGKGDELELEFKVFVHLPGFSLAHQQVQGLAHVLLHPSQRQGIGGEFGPVEL